MAFAVAGTFFLAFAVAGTGLKTNGRYRRKQSGTEGWPRRKQEATTQDIKEVSLGTAKNQAKKILDLKIN